MKFIPHADKIEFSPLKQDSILADDKDTMVEAGTVVAVGANVKSVEVGDIIAFLSYGAEQTPEVEGEKHWTVRDCPEFLMGYWKP